MSDRSPSSASSLGDGIYQIPVPITGNPLGHTLVYALESPGGLVLVDAGWDDDNGWDGLVRGLEDIGHSVGDVEGVVLTHFHPDHTGLCGRVRDASGAWIAMHGDDYDMFEKMVEPHDRGWLDVQRANLAAAGASPTDLDAFEESSRGGTPTGAHSRPDRVLGDDEVIPLAGRNLRAVYTPGHTPGHVCFYLEDVDTMFTGDHVLQKTTPHVGNFVYPLDERDALADFLESLRRVQKMDVTRGLGAHGLPIEDVAGRTGDLIDHHEERLAHLVGAFSDDELTVWQVAARMKWYRPWDAISPLGKTMALSEGAAHLRHLVARGQVAQVPGSDPARFVRT
ncbi:MBL fold metallo-hydrolase [Rhodococcus triatomae]|uniref:Glyoxylase, beta-lactamase superfamily II n=1 Tax=Rhodococcus triatomae TaxID=300028 RepID=A0A1G8M8I3_9NOCA|nr:MBL fold metallo-hydrolase [Rhodococcus triatomae]QNG18162.1 MBL fold metallo-hydrolase [Rhodococcus triatomae]QNG22168.1 MBL fold metallo-hydrolase [Rhodococcus triatomae]SDI64299.1 Glyoxylase, beta-lactamase superfamily II [Rhodococcus triatomae]